MSQQACAEFFTKVNAEAALQQELTTALEDKEGMESANAFVWVGAKHGYEFTAEEAVQKYQEIQAAAEDELDDEALENVAGGKGARCGKGGGCTVELINAIIEEIADRNDVNVKIPTCGCLKSWLNL